MSAGIGTVSKSEQRFRRTWAKSASVSRAGRIHSGAGASTRGMATTPRARIRRAAGEFDRDQRLILFAFSALRATAPGMKRRRKGFVFSIKGSLSAKGAGWLADAETPAAPLVVNEPISCSNPIGVSNLLLWTPLVGISLQGPSQIKRQPVRRNESSCPVTNMGHTRRKPSMVEIRQLVGGIPLSAIGPGPRRGLARHPPPTNGANDKYDCINPYSSRSRLFLVVSALGRRPWRSNTHLRCG